MLAQMLETDEDWVVTIVRIVLGVVFFFAHGAQIALGWFGGPGLRSTVRIFREQLRIPAPLEVLVVAAEFLCGLGLVLGLLSRIAALVIAVVMFVALLTVYWKFGFFMNWYGDQRGHGIEYHVLVLVLPLVVMIEGGGPTSPAQVLYKHVLTQDGVTLGAGTE